MDDAPEVRPRLDGENAQVKEMVEWFFERFEDPAENMPHDEGEYVHIDGGPYYAEEEITTEFEQKASPQDIQRALELIAPFGTAWAKVDWTS